MRCQMWFGRGVCGPSAHFCEQEAEPGAKICKYCNAQAAHAKFEQAKDRVCEEVKAIELWPEGFDKLYAARFAFLEAEREAKFAKFGRLVYEHLVSQDNDSWFGDEWSEEIMPIAVLCGLAEQRPYDPERDGEGIEDAEPGDEIWVWLKENR